MRADGQTRRTMGIRAGGRSARVVAAVVRATLEEIARTPYAALRVEDVAARAGVNKTTVYRRWPTKAALVTAAVRAVAGFDAPVPDTGSARADLVEVLRRWTAAAGGAEGRAVARLLAVEGEHAEVAEIARGLAEEARRRRLSILERAQARGEIPVGVDGWLVLDAIVAPVVTRVLRRGDAVDDATLVRLVDLVMTGVEHGGGRMTAA